MLDEEKPAQVWFLFPMYLEREWVGVVCLDMWARFTDNKRGVQ